MESAKRYQLLTDDELFERLQQASIEEVAAFECYESDKDWSAKQHHWADVLAALATEIERRGPGLHPRYLQLLKSPHPAVRLTGALIARRFAPNAAVPVLEDLADAGKYGGHIALNAGMTLDSMRDRGEIPPK